MLIGQTSVRRRRRLLAFLAVAVLTFVFVAGSAFAFDPTGAPQAGKAVFASQYAGQSLPQAIGNVSRSVSFVWIALTGFLVFFMQLGFACVETGLVRAKNASHTMMMNLAIFGLGVLGFYISGFAIAFGGGGGIAAVGGSPHLNGLFEIAKGWGIFGTKGFFLTGAGNYDVAVMSLFLFQVVFMDAAATIPTGAMAERFNFKAFVPYGILVGAVIYPVFANWVWGGGWLAHLGTNMGLGNGYLDFAGSTVVHMCGGMMALVGAWMLGPRIGKYNKDGSPNPILAHNVPMVVIGCLILFFGWFGFNSGSTLSAPDVRFNVVMLNTLMAGAMGMLSAMIVVWLKFGKPDPTMTANGALAGLVAITAPCAFVNPTGAVIIGLAAGAIVVYSVVFFERVAKIDDPCGAISVHGVCGLFGAISVGLFADGTYGAGFNGISHPVAGLLYGGGFGQLIAQVVGPLALVVWVGGSSLVMFKVLDRLIGLRSSEEDEIEGLDATEIGLPAYPEGVPESAHVPGSVPMPVPAPALAASRPAEA